MSNRSGPTDRDPEGPRQIEKAGVGVPAKRVGRRAWTLGQAGKRALRFSYASSEESIREAARRLGEYLR